MTDPDGGDDGQKDRIVPLIAALAGVSAFIAALAVVPSGYIEVFLGVTAAAIAFAGLLVGWRALKRAAAEQAQSRQRVRAAESDLEDAVRNRVAIRTLDGDGFIYGGSLYHSADGRGDPHVILPEPAADTETAPNGDSTRSLAGDLELSALWKVTHARLGDYHGTAVGQAKRAFRNAQVATGAGFVLLVVFVYAAFHAKSTTASATAGVLGAVAAALSGYIARTFIKSQEMTSAALHRYFEEPLALSRYLATERLVRDAGLSQERQADLLYAIVHSMVTGESPGKPATPPEAAEGEQLS